jgi:hypothetical protein
MGKKVEGKERTVNSEYIHLCIYLFKILVNIILGANGVKLREKRKEKKVKNNMLPYNYYRPKYRNADF